MRWGMLVGVWLLYACFGMTSTALAPIVGRVTTELAISHGAMGTILGVWQLVYIGAAVPAGALLDRLGPRRALVIGAFFIGLSGMMRAVAWDFFSLLFAVALFGLGGPIVSSGAPKVVSQWFTGRDRGLAMGIYMTGPGIGAIFALAGTNAVLMPLVDQQWRHVLLIWAIITFASGAIWFAIASRPQARAMDQAGTGATRAPQREILRTLLAAPAMRVILLMAIGIFMFNHGLNNWLPELLSVDGMSAVAAGYWATVPTLVGIFASLTIPRLAVPQRRLLIFAGLCVCAGLGSVLLHAEPGPALLAGLFLQGIARSTLMTIAMLILVDMREVGERHAGTASGLFFSAAEIGGASGPVIMGVLYDATGGFDAGLYFLTCIAGLLLLGVAQLRRLNKLGSDPGG